MPKHDMSYEVIDRTANMVERLLERLEVMLPYGPSAVQMTPAEVRRQLARAKGDKILAFMDMLGEEETMKLLMEARHAP